MIQEHIYGIKKIKVDSSVYNSELYFSRKGDVGLNDKNIVQFLSKDGTELYRHETPRDYGKPIPYRIKIPANTDTIVFTMSNNIYGDDVHIHEVYVDNTPRILVDNKYAMLTSYGVEKPYSEITINYYATSERRLYKIDNGDWQEYKGTIRLETGQTVYAKGIDKNGKETNQIPSYTSALPKDALRVAAYDGNEETYDDLGAYLRNKKDKSRQQCI